MGRRRKAGDEWLEGMPVYRGRSAWEYKPGDGRTIKLLPLAANPRAVIRAFEEAKRKHEQKSGSVSELTDQFLESPEFKKLATSTQKKYRGYAKVIAGVFGRQAACGVKPKDIRRYMDLRGQQHEVQANREHAFMSKMFGWAYERGRITMNPCRGVRKFTEVARDRYITDAEYAALLDCADPLVQAIVEISFCCAARVGDVLELKTDQLRDTGVYIKQGKTGKAQIKKWNPRLRKAIRQAQAAQVARSPVRVVANEKGQHLTYDAFNNRWRKAIEAAKAKYPNLKFDFTTHDIKAKSISDYEGDKQKFSGHKSARMVQTYDRKTEEVDSNE